MEHPVSELVSGLDLVQEQFRILRASRCDFGQDDVVLRGTRSSAASRPRWRTRVSGRTPVEPPAGSRRSGRTSADTHCHTGYMVSMHDDSLLAKLVVYGSTRDGYDYPDEVLDALLPHVRQNLDAAAALRALPLCEVPNALVLPAGGRK